MWAYTAKIAEICKVEWRDTNGLVQWADNVGEWMDRDLFSLSLVIVEDGGLLVSLQLSVVVVVVVNVVVVDDGGFLVPLLLVACMVWCMYVLYVVITVRLWWVSRLLPRSSP